MALADLVLEGLTLILVIALGAVLIGGLTYLSTTVASTNEAKLVYMGTYIYIPAAVYVNGTLYVPMYNIGHYTVVVRQLFIMVGNTLISQTLSTTLAPGQYYVYTTTLSQRPIAVTVVASPTVEPKLKLEFGANVTEPGQVELTPISTSTGGNGLIEVVVNDVYGAGWAVSWSYADQSYSVSESTSYTWFINPPYVPIQITFNAQVTNNPSDYTCQIQPSQIINTYGPGSKQTFNVDCEKLAEGVYLTLDPVVQYWVADWEYVVTWTGSTSGYIKGYANLYDAWMYGSNPSTPVWASGATLVSGGNNSLAVTTWFIPTDGPITINVEFTNTEPGLGCPNGNCPTAYTVPTTPITVYPFTNTTVQLVFSGTGMQTFGVSVSVSDPYGAGWSVTWSGIGGTVSGSQSGSGSYSWTVVTSGSGTVYFTATITKTPSGYTSCTISPASTSVTLTNSNPTASVTFTVTCSGSPPPPPPPPPPQPPQVYGCLFTFSLGSSPSGAPTPSYSGAGPGTMFVPSGQSVGGSVSAPSSGSTSSGGGGQTWWEFMDYTLSFSGSGTLYFNGVSRGPGTWNYAKTQFSWQFVCPSGLSQNVTASFSVIANYVEDYVTLSGPTSVNNPGDYTYNLNWDIWPGSAIGESWTVLYPNGNPFVVKATLTATSGTYSVSYPTSISCSNGGNPQSIQASLVSGQTGVTGTQNTASATINVQFLCQPTRTP